MSNNTDFRDLLFELSDAKAHFLIVGAYAVIYYSEPRYTKDIDVWIEPTKENANAVVRALQKFGAPADHFSLEDLTKKDMILQLGIEPNRIDILTSIDGLDFETAWQNSQKTTYEDVTIHLLSIDDLIASKKAAARPQDLLDIDKLVNAKMWITKAAPQRLHSREIKKPVKKKR